MISTDENMSGYITSGRKILLKARLASIQARLLILYDTAIGAAGHENESYAFDSGEGSQRTTRRDTSKIFEDIRRLEATEDHLLNELNNIGLVAVKLRRKS
jgi:hypothetical protein